MRSISSTFLIDSFGRLFSRIGVTVAYFLGEFLFPFMGLGGRETQIDLAKVKRVLVVRLDEIGDVVMTTPFLRELRRNLPDAWITLVVKPAGFNLVELCPYLNEVLTYDWRAQSLFQPLQRHWRAVKLARRHLWQRRFELAIVPRWDFDGYHATYVMYLSGARCRVAYSENVNGVKKRQNRGFDQLITHGIDGDGLKHEVERNMDAIRFLGGEVLGDCLELWLGEEDERFADKVLDEHGLSAADLLIGLGPGAGAAKRQWPLDRYKKLCKWLQTQFVAKFLVVGGLGEEALGHELEREFGPLAVNYVGKATLRQSAALLKRASLYVGNDAGPMHMAGALGVPVVEISCHPKSGSHYSANSPSRFGPWCQRRAILQPEGPAAGCDRECVARAPHCILGVAVEDAQQAIWKMLTNERIAGCSTAVQRSET